MTALTGSSPASPRCTAIFNQCERHADAAAPSDAGAFARLLALRDSAATVERPESENPPRLDPRPAPSAPIRDEPVGADRHRPRQAAGRCAGRHGDDADPAAAVSAKPASDADSDAPLATAMDPSPPAAEEEDACAPEPAAAAPSGTGATVATPIPPAPAPPATPAGEEPGTERSAAVLPPARAAGTPPAGVLAAGSGEAALPPDIAGQAGPTAAGTAVPPAGSGGGAAEPPGAPAAAAPSTTAAAAATTAAVIAVDTAPTASAAAPAPTGEEAAAVSAVPGGEDSDAALVLAPSSDNAAADGAASDPGGNPAAGGPGHAGVAGTSEASRTKAAAPHPPALQLAEPLVRAARAGIRRVEIALEPAALGHVEVRLDFTGDGRMSALIVADNRAALDALRGDAQALAQALNEAGIDSAGLDFGLRHRESSRDEGGSAVFGHGVVHATADEPSPAAAGRTAPAVPATGRLDIRA